jgi:hypothetical protein
VNLFAVAEVSDQVDELARTFPRIAVSLGKRGEGKARRYFLQNIVLLPASAAPQAASFAAFATAPAKPIHQDPSGALRVALDLQAITGLPFTQAAIHAQHALSRSTSR